MRISDWSSDVCSSDLPAIFSTSVETVGLGRRPAMVRPASAAAMSARAASAAGALPPAAATALSRVSGGAAGGAVVALSCACATAAQDTAANKAANILCMLISLINTHKHRRRHAVRGGQLTTN